MSNFRSKTTDFAHLGTPSKYQGVEIASNEEQ